MNQESETPRQDPRRMVPKWTVRHGRLSLAWKVSTPPAPRPQPGRAAMPEATTVDREAAE